MNYRKRSRCIVFLSIIFSVLVLGGMAGCTFKHVTPEISTVPVEKYSVVAVGDIAMYDKLWDYLVPHFRRGLVQGLTKLKAFETIQESKPETLSGSTILLTGMITEVNKGSAALRWIVGFGAGKATVKGVFEISDSRGTTLEKFEAAESYAGGAGLGGASFLDMEDLMRRFGETIAKRIAQWAQSGKIER